MAFRYAPASPRDVYKRQPYVVMMQIHSQKAFEDLQLSGNVSLQMMSTDLTLPPDKLILKKAEKQGLYQALDIASVWLDRLKKS